MLSMVVVSLLAASTVQAGLLSSVTSAVSSAVSTATSTAETVASTVANATTTAVTTATETVSNATSTVTSTVSDVVSTVTSAVSTATNYYTIAYAWKIYSGCLRSCLMYITNDTARDACATTREAYCTKMKAYSLPTLVTTYVAKLAAKSVLSSIF